jgi:uncharacterized protein YjiS (DUF1127 family)
MRDDTRLERIAAPLADPSTLRFAVSDPARGARSPRRGAIALIAHAVRSALAWRRARQQARSARDALRGLDDRALRDLGIDRSEISSLAAEFAGEAERTRVRAMRGAHFAP